MSPYLLKLKEEKERLLLDTSEAEKQLMLLEKKVALERETQAALDPEVGAAEVRAMQREIHRMRLRYAQLQRRQECARTMQLGTKQSSICRATCTGGWQCSCALPTLKPRRQCHASHAGMPVAKQLAGCTEPKRSRLTLTV